MDFKSKQSFIYSVHSGRVEDSCVDVDGCTGMVAGLLLHVVARIVYAFMNEAVHTVPFSNNDHTVPLHCLPT